MSDVANKKQQWPIFQLAISFLYIMLWYWIFNMGDQRIISYFPCMVKADRYNTTLTASWGSSQTGGCQPQKVGMNLLFCQFSPEHCMKMKELNHWGASPTLPPPSTLPSDTVMRPLNAVFYMDQGNIQ